MLNVNRARELDNWTTDLRTKLISTVNVEGIGRLRPICPICPAMFSVHVDYVGLWGGKRLKMFVQRSASSAWKRHFIAPCCAMQQCFKACATHVALHYLFVSPEKIAKDEEHRMNGKEIYWTGIDLQQKSGCGLVSM